jgi:hypothetical protein
MIIFFPDFSHPYKLLPPIHSPQPRCKDQKEGYGNCLRRKKKILKRIVTENA